MEDNKAYEEGRENAPETSDEKMNEPNLNKTLRRFERLLMHYHAAGARRFGPQGNPNRGQGRVLALLKMQPDIAQRDLSYLLDMRQQSLSELLGKLEQKGYITREADERDKRIVNIHLTEEGKKAAQEVPEQKTDKIFDCLEPEEQAQFAQYLGRINEALESKLEEMGVDACHGHGPHGRPPAYGPGPHPHGPYGGRGDRGYGGCKPQGSSDWDGPRHHRDWGGQTACAPRNESGDVRHGRGYGPGGDGKVRAYRSPVVMPGMELMLLVDDFDEDGLAFFDL